MSLPNLILKTKHNIKLPKPSDISLKEEMSINGLQFVMNLQRLDNWCWAAVTESISLFYIPTSNWTQCSLANIEFDRDDCCPDNSVCDRQWYLQNSLSRSENLADFLTGNLAFQNIAQQISNGHPVACRIGWQNGGGHFIVIYGINQNDPNQWLEIADPMYGNSNYPYDQFRNSYRGSGKWTHSYLTKKGV